MVTTKPVETKKPIKENLGFASKGITSTKTNKVVEDATVTRFKRLAFGK